MPYVTRSNLTTHKHDYSRTKKYYSGIAKDISSQLLLFQYEKGRDIYPNRYHVIHKLTGLVIADIEYNMYGMVKRSFEAERWTLDKDDKNTLIRLPKDRNDTFKFKITCHIRYDIKESEND
jgi:hypothetical protein